MIPMRPVPSTADSSLPSLDLPPAIRQLIDSQAIGPATPMPGLGLATAMRQQGPQMPPSYAQGGLVGPQGMPMMPGVPRASGGPPGVSAEGGQGLSPQQIQVEAQRFASQHPEQMQQIQAAIQQALQSGQMTQDDLNLVVQMAMAALQNPALYPQLRQIAIQRGLATEQELSPQFDPGLLFVLVLIGQSLQGGGQQPQAPMLSPQAMPSMARGGALPARSPRKDGSVPIRAHEGEYVIPAHVVRAKGTDFFDKMIQQYDPNNPGNSR